MGANINRKVVSMVSRKRIVTLVGIIGVQHKSGGHGL